MGLEFNPGEEPGPARGNIHRHERGAAGVLRPRPFVDRIDDILRGKAGRDRVSTRDRSRGLGIVRRVTLCVAAVAIAKGSHNIERTVELVSPSVRTRQPHGDRGRPAVGIELDVNEIANGGVCRHVHFEQDGSIGPGLPGLHNIFHGGILRRHDEMPRYILTGGRKFGIPEPIAQGVFVFDVRAGRQE